VTDEEFRFSRIAMAGYAPTLLYGVGEGAVLPVVVLSARDLGASLSTAALIVTLLGLGSLAFSIPSSMVVNRFAERGAIIGAGAIGAAACLVCAAAGSVWAFAVAVVVLGAAGSVFRLARQSYLSEVVPIHRRALALSTLGGVMRIGVLIGPVLGGVAISAFGLDGAYVVAATALVLAGLAGLLMSEPAGRASMRATPPTSMRRLVVEHRRVFATVGVGVLLVNAIRAMRQVVIPLWASHVGLDAATVSWVFAVAAAADVVMFIPSGLAMDRFGRRVVAVPAMIIMGIAVACMPLTDGAVELGIVAAMVGLGNGMSSGVAMTLGADYAPPASRASFLGIWRFLAELGGFGGPALLSGVTAVAGITSGVVASGGVGLVAALVLGLALRPGRSGVDQRPGGQASDTVTP